jgi:phage terminase large subunit-like protein
MRITIEQARTLPKDMQAAWWASLSPLEADGYLHDWSFLARPEQTLPSGTWTHWLYLAGRGAGKALALDTPILTSDGWTTMGTLTTDNIVFDEQGNETAILQVHPVLYGRKCYEVCFSDGAKITADAEHLWTVRTTYSGGAKFRTVTTEEIRKTLTCVGERRNSIPVCEPLSYKEQELLVDPYVLGVWLGDGSTGSAVITTMDAGILQELKKRGVVCNKHIQSSKSTGRANMYGMKYKNHVPPSNTNGCFVSSGSLHADLKTLGVLNDKHIPEQYLRGSTEQRKALMQGLVDTDGFVSERGEYEITSVKPKLAEKIFDLALGLGLKATIKKLPGYYKVAGERRYTKDVYTVRFRSPFVLAKLSRKVERAKISRRRYIVAVEEVPSVPVRCITVASPSNLYLAGRQLIPTHNTRTGAETARLKVKTGCKRLGLIAPTASDARDVMVEGEALALDTEVATTHGFKTIETLKEGDIVFGADGRPTPVIAKSPIFNVPCARVQVAKVEPIIASLNHKWITLSRKERRDGKWAPSIKDTTQIMKSLFEHDRGDLKNHAVELCAPVAFEEKELPIPPYVLGVWLGDGTSDSGEISIDPRDSEIIEHIKAEGFKVDRYKGEVEGLITLLRKNGFLKNKYIPEAYLQGSIEQRLCLLQGLMDSDGGVLSGGTCYFSNTNPLLIAGFRELAQSLGFRAGSIQALPPQNPCHKVCYEVIFAKPPSGLDCCRLKRKLERVTSSNRKRTRLIESIEPCESVPTQCIQVGNKDGSFLVTRDYLITHNSGILAVCWSGDKTDDGVYIGKPTYEPSKRRLTWENGAIATLYSADEPERLRGPQHDYIWCFIKGTKVSTPAGEVCIQSLKPGDLVVTRDGPKPILANSKRKAAVGKVTFSNGAVLVGTYEHPIYTNEGWVNLGELSCHRVLSLGSHTAISIASTWQPTGEQDVYCLKVAETPEYFANSILVHNCDELASWRRPETWDLAMFGLRLGVNPQAFISTTPKPKKLILELMKDPNCKVTRGSTYDNRANLAENFFTTVITKYEGTRLGEQELMGVVLEEAEGALWSREVLDATRIREFDWRNQALRIVVAVDPATSSTTGESNECGIIVCAIDYEKHGYVLADYSGVYTPGEWAKKAVMAYNVYGADRVIAEGNQGGEMVRHTIQTEDSSVAVKIVYASRGKIARAEPVAALFEQGRSHIVGSLPVLEDQLCVWEALSGEESPDRLDAMVWGLTELQVGKGITGVGFLAGAY